MTTSISLPESSADPTQESNKVELYAKDVAGVAQLFGRSDDGIVHQLTPASGWADDGTVVRLTTASDQVSIGAALPIGAAALSVTGEAAVTNQTGSYMESLDAGGGLGGGRVSTDSTGAAPGQGARLQGLDDTNAQVALVRAGGVGSGEGVVRMEASSALGTVTQQMDGANWFAGAAETVGTGDASLQMFPADNRLRVAGPAGVGEASIHMTPGVGEGSLEIGITGNTIGFLGAVPVVRQGIPAADAATPIGAALIALGLCYIAP